MIMFRKFQKIVRTLDTFMMSAAVLLISAVLYCFFYYHSILMLMLSVVGASPVQHHLYKIFGLQPIRGHKPLK